ncbi:MAG: NAD-dependent epimerase/dehydratase family protein [Crocinitomicaceae bacterium]|nr:NAD-dependent epimerase/dehydratase family protein [Crocinitomicaceae bacterium]
MKILVTGPDGLLGSNLIRELLQRNSEVIAMTQNANCAANIKELPVEFRPCDLLNSAELIRISKDADAIIHCAANTSMFPARSEIVNKVNINGTKNIIEACLKNQIKRLIVVGSANSFGPGCKIFREMKQNLMRVNILVWIIWIQNSKQ